MKDLIEVIESSFRLKELCSGEFSSLKVGPMKFSIRHWDGGLLGNVSYMVASGMMGLMKMETLIINPTEADLPLLSMDTVLAMGKLTTIAEIYNTTVNGFDEKACLEVKDSISSYPDRPVAENWYDNIKLGCSWGKKTGKKTLAEMEKALSDYMKAYLSVASGKSRIEDADLLAEKKKRSDAYVNGLLEHGGPSTDVFVKNLGREKTAKLFHEILFDKL